MSYDPDQTIDRMVNHKAEVGGHRYRTVRLNGGKIPLCTATYNYQQLDETKEMVARRIAALWNLTQGIGTADLEHLVSKGMTLSKLMDMALENVRSRGSATPGKAKQ